MGQNPGQRQPFLWHLRVATDVTDAISKRPEEQRRAVLDLVTELRKNPRSRALRVLPLKGISARNLFTVPIGEPAFAVLTFQILADHPAIHLFDIVFFE